MLASSIPYKFATPWAADATSQYITATIPPTATSPAASQQLGFPPATALPIGSGGTPPNIADFNGGMNYETSWTQWIQAGGPIGYDATFSTNIGGYPNGAVIRAAKTGQFWLSTADNNTSNPDTGGANWLGMVSGVRALLTFAATTSWTCPAGVYQVRAKVAGGGGGGGTGGSSFAGAGGGAGGYTEGLVAVTPGTAYTITVGGGGGGGGNPGGNGGTSSFATLSATGGQGGAGGGGAAAGGAGGTGTGGSLALVGGWGNDGNATSGTGAGGSGGTTVFGGGGRSGAGGGEFGAAYGAGGGGCYGTTGYGGNGASGVVILEY